VACADREEARAPEAGNALQAEDTGPATCGRRAKCRRARVEGVLVQGRLTRALATALLLALATVRTISAQSVTLRLGGFRTTYADSLSGAAASAGADAVWTSPRARAILGWTASVFDVGGWAATGSASALRVLTAGRSRGIYAKADASGYGFEGGTWAGTATAGAAAAADAGALVASLSAVAGGVRRIDATDDPMGTLTARLGHDTGTWNYEAWGSATRAGAVRYQDLGAGLHVDWAHVTLDLTGGGRFGDLGDQAWGNVRAAVRIKGPAWLEASGGKYPPDVTGFQHGTFIQAGLRVGLGRTPMRATPTADPAIDIRHEAGGTVVVILREANREPVAIAGDWDAWQPTQLESLGGGRWRARLRLDPGIHRFTLLDREGNAFVPSGITTEPDDFGTMTGLLTVSRP